MRRLALPTSGTRAGFALALLAALALPGAVHSAELGSYGMTSFSFTQLHSTGSETGRSPAGSDDRAVGMRVGFGYQGDPHRAFECTLGTLGAVEAQSSAGATTSWAATAYGCGGLVLMPHDERTSWFLKGGLQKIRLRMSGSGVDSSREASDWSPSLAVGAKRDFSKAVGWRFEYERLFDVGDARLTGKFALGTFLVSLYYGFK